MENIIEEMIESAWRHNDYNMAALAYKLMAEMAKTINCPSNWREIGRDMAAQYGKFDNPRNNWIMLHCGLDDFG